MVDNYTVLYSDQKSQLGKCVSKTPVPRHNSKIEKLFNVLEAHALQREKLTKHATFVLKGLSKGAF